MSVLTPFKAPLTQKKADNIPKLYLNTPHSKENDELSEPEIPEGDGKFEDVVISSVIGIPAMLCLWWTFNRGDYENFENDTRGSENTDDYLPSLVHKVRYVYLA